MRRRLRSIALFGEVRLLELSPSPLFPSPAEEIEFLVDDDVLVDEVEEDGGDDVAVMGAAEKIPEDLGALCRVAAASQLDILDEAKAGRGGNNQSNLVAFEVIGSVLLQLLLMVF